MERLAGALLDDIAEPPSLPGREIEQQMADLTIKMVVPANLDDLPAEKLLAFRDWYPGERAAFQQQKQAMVTSLDVEGIRDPEALRDHLQVQYELHVQPQLADLKQRLHDARIDTTMALTNVKTLLPTSLAAGVCLEMLHFGQPVVGTGAVALTLGVWRVWQDQRRARRKAFGALPASAYLYHIGTDLRPSDLASRINLDDRIRGRARLVTDRAVPVFGGFVWSAGSRRVAVLPDVLGLGTGSDRAGEPPFLVAGTGVTGQAGAGRARSRCQQARKASFQGQVRLIFSTRARAWRTSRAGRLSNR
jgi:Family of unknown function (DUF6236)